MKNPMRVAAGLRGSAKGFQRYGRAVYQDLGPIMRSVAEGEREPFVMDLALFLQSEQRKASRRPRAQLYKLLRMSR